MNLITRNNQKTLIFLKKEADFFLASVVHVIYEASGKVSRQLIGTQKISQTQVDELYAQKTDLQNKDIYIIDTDESVATAQILLDGISNVFDLENGILIPSPYFTTIVDEVTFLSTQKTRGPNR